jgi:hypothetical protein
MSHVDDVVELRLLFHAYGLSDEGVCEHWV